MSDEKRITNSKITHLVVDIAIKIAVVFLVAIWCFQIVRPFIMPILWAGIIAIALYPLVVKISTQLKIKQGKASVLVTVCALALLLVPTVMFSKTLVTSTQDFIGQIKEGRLVIQPPKASVADVPLVGGQLYTLWSNASTNLESVLKNYVPEIKGFATTAAAAVGNFSVAVLQFFVAIIIAGVFMAKAKGAQQIFQNIAVRLAGKNGEGFAQLSVATVRSVVQGVIGVAFIQASLAGIGMVLAGVPAAGVWMLLVLIVAIVQLPPLLVLGPVVIYVFSVQPTTVAVVFMIWSVLVSFGDTALKPLLMGRGADIPILVILLGALGGMVLSGIVGLFVGAVVLALGYKLFIAWIELESSEGLKTKTPPQS